MSFYVYILMCADGSYYTGHTDNLEKRIVEHKMDEVRGYTYVRRPLRLVFCEEFSSRDDAFRLEHRIKGWSRAKKEALIDGDWEGLSILAKARSPQALN